MTGKSFAPFLVKKFKIAGSVLFSKTFPVKSKLDFQFDFIRPTANNSHLKTLLDNVSVQKYLKFIEDDKSYLENLSFKNVFVELLEKKKQLEFDMKKLDEMAAEGDEELNKLVEEERKNIREDLDVTKLKILERIGIHDETEEKDDESTGKMVEKNTEIQLIPAVGGDEAKLFAEELFDMYMNYIAYKNWTVLMAELKVGKTELCGGGQIILAGVIPFYYLKHEGGVHRVQRVPATEKMGRTHTSTCSVFVHRKQSCSGIHLKEKDLEFQAVRSSGPGGQNVNKLETSIRLKHIPTGISVDCQESRYQFDNRKFALQKLKDKLLNMELEKITSSKKALKKEQTGTNDYADKIRTYHFTQNRVTDHRLNYTIHNLAGFLSGGKELDRLIFKLKEFGERERILNHVDKTLNSKVSRKL